jgi:hypothetical protein
MFLKHGKILWFNTTISSLTLDLCFTVPEENNNGFILISANGGLNQQRVAVCNAVVVAALLNATLVLPRFLYSSVWKDTRLELQL